MRQKKGRIVAAALGLMLAVFLTGCGRKVPEIGEVQEAGIYLTKEGKVTAFLVEKFDKEYYDEAELEDMILAEIEDYNSQAKAGSLAENEKTLPVVLADIMSPEEKIAAGQTGADTITVQFDYAGTEDYSAYNGKVLYLGTVAQAKVDGYPVQKDLTSVSDGITLTKMEAQNLTEHYLLVLQESIPVHVPYEVLYVSSGVSVNENTVIFDGTDGGFAYVIMK